MILLQSLNMAAGHFNTFIYTEGCSSRKASINPCSINRGSQSFREAAFTFRFNTFNWSLSEDFVGNLESSREIHSTSHSHVATHR